MAEKGLPPKEVLLSLGVWDTRILLKQWGQKGEGYKPDEAYNE